MIFLERMLLTRISLVNNDLSRKNAVSCESLRSFDCEHYGKNLRYILLKIVVMKSISRSGLDVVHAKICYAGHNTCLAHILPLQAVYGILSVII